MPRRLLSLPHAALSALCFVLAGVLMLGVALLTALVIESRSKSVIEENMAQAKLDWVQVTTNGLQVHLGGTAPDEASRFRALNLAGSLVDSSRVHDGLEVAPAKAIEAPRFSVEMLRNDDGIQLIGLVPEFPSDDGLGTEALVQAASDLIDGGDPADMLQAAAYPAPAGWDAALRFGVTALGTLKRSKISVMAGRVEVTAIAESEAEKRRFETALQRAKPEDMSLVLDISAPRPVITPFTLRFIKDAGGARFDACSADTERARRLILTAATAAGVTGQASCTIGLGTPSPRWAEGVVAAIAAVSAMGNGTVTFADTDITLTAGDGVTQAAFDTALGELRAALPDAFSLDAIAPKAEGAAMGPAEFTAKRDADGKTTLRGRLLDEAQQSAITAFARAAFGASQVRVLTRLDSELPDGWPVRVLAGLDSLAQLHEGTLMVRADRVEVKGVTGNADARAKITQILSSRLGQGQNFGVDVTYDKKLDPLAGLPTPLECVAEVTAALESRKITFTPGSAEIASDAGPLMETLAEILRRCPAIPLEIGGHTDSQGSDSGNQALSQARAEAVLMALQGRRVDTSAMVAVGYGEATPIADNGTEAGREANRRIEFVLKGEAAAPASPEAPAPQEAPEAAPKETPAEPAPPAESAAPAPEAPSETPAAVAPAGETGAEAPQGPDFSTDTSPSVAPTEKTMRPQPRPAQQD